jgi:hypothetical protein
LGYTLHESRKSKPTRLLEEFDAQRTAAVATAQLDGTSPQELPAQMDEMDARVAAELDAVAEQSGWAEPAEAPPGQVPAYMAVNHMLFDSWVHERDLMLPAGEMPVTDPNEAAMVGSYALGLTGVARAFGDSAPPALNVQIHLTDIDRHLFVEVSEARTSVSFGERDGPVNISASTGDMVDFTTGRRESVTGDEVGCAYLSRLATVMR